MIVTVEIDSVKAHYNLTKVHYISDLLAGQMLIVKSRLNDKICKVRVVSISKKSAIVERVRSKPTGIFWKLRVMDFERGIFIIN